MSHVTFHSLSNLVAVTPSISHSKFIFLAAKLVLLHERKNNTCDYNAHNMGFRFDMVLKSHFPLHYHGYNLSENHNNVV